MHKFKVFFENTKNDTKNKNIDNISSKLKEIISKIPKEILDYEDVNIEDDLKFKYNKKINKKLDDISKNIYQYIIDNLNKNTEIGNKLLKNIEEYGLSISIKDFLNTYINDKNIKKEDNIKLFILLNQEDILSIIIKLIQNEIL